MTETTRTDILQRIINLRAKAENGASEAEAMACIEKAERLMQAYRVAEAELAMAEASGEIKIDIITKTYDGLVSGTGGYQRRPNRHNSFLCASAIAEFTKTRVVFLGQGRSAEFLGNRVDVEMAIFLLDVVKNAMDNGYNTWRREYGAATGYGAKKSFQISMANRVSARLREMALDRAVQEAETKKQEMKRLNMDPTVLESMVRGENMAELTDTAMVLVVADARLKTEINKEFKSRYPKLGTLGGVSRGNNYTAGQAGRKAGDTVHLGRVICNPNQKKIA